MCICIQPGMEVVNFLMLNSPGPEVIKLFSCSTQLTMKFELLIKSQIQFIALSHSDVVFIMLINVKMATITGILTFNSMINVVLS